MPSPAFCRTFSVNKDEGKIAVISCLFYPISKKGQNSVAFKEVTRKVRDCTLQTGKLCYNAININFVLVLVYVQNCKTAQSLICHGPS